MTHVTRLNSGANSHADYPVRSAGVQGSGLAREARGDVNHALDLTDYLLGLGKAAKTADNYAKYVRRLARWCALNGYDLATLEPHVLRKWVDDTIPPGRESRQQVYSACKHLYTMLGRQDAPWTAIRIPNKRASEPHPLLGADAVRLRDAALMVGGREGTATLGLLYSAARPSEVAEWRWDGVDLEQATLRFWRKKVRDWHTVPMHPTLVEALERFEGPWREGFLFPGDRGRPYVTPTTVNHWVHRVAGVAGVEATPRRLRATWACHALEATGQIDAVASMLGHSDISTTQRYYTITTMRRKREAAAAIPW